MTLSEARKVLGLGPDDDPRPLLDEFKEARERIAEMVRTAPTATLAARYQQGLTDFDQALAAVREYLEDLGLAPKTPKPAPLPAPPVSPEPAPVIAAAEPAEKESAPPEAAAEQPVTSPAPAQVPAIASEASKPPDSVTTPAPAPASAEPAATDPPPAPSEPVIPAASELPPEKTTAPEPHPAPPETLKPDPVFVFKQAESLPPTAPPIKTLSAEKDEPPAPPAPPEPGETQTGDPSHSGKKAKVAVFLSIVLLGIAGGLYYLKLEEDKRIQVERKIIDLEKHGNQLIDLRRWPEASEVFNRIEALNPKAQPLDHGRQRIAEGMAEEQSQFVGYWAGQAKASLEAKRFDEAETAAQQVLDRYPGDTEAAALLEEITAARALEADRLTIANARQALQQRKWDDAIATANKILSTRPHDEDAKSLLQDATAAKKKAAADLATARSLLAQARELDTGEYNKQVSDWIHEAAALAPEDEEIKNYLEKIGSYARTLRVPGDFATPAEALAQAHDRDRILIAAGTWKGPLHVNASIDLQGEGSATTIITCPAQEGNTITLGPEAKGARITGFTFRHESFAPGEERFSTAIVQGSSVDFVDCRFLEASGHGLAVIQGGHAIISRSQFADNGWNGVAASGEGSLLEVRESESVRNFGHGIESWDGAAIILSGNRCEDNSRNGIHADNGGGSVTLEKNLLIGNREFGLVLSSAGSGKASGNLARGNLLGGYAIRASANPVAFSGNEATKNNGPGLVLDIGLPAEAYSANTSTGNAGQQVLGNTNLTVKDEVPPEAGPEPANPSAPPKAMPVIEE